MQYYRDFADADGISDWTQDRYASTVTWSVAAGVLSGGTTSAAEALTWNDIDADADRDDVEIYGEYRTASTTSITRNICVARGNTEAAITPSSYYLLTLRNTTLRVFSKVPGGSQVQIADEPHGLTLSTSTWYRYRFRVVGGTIQARVWPAGDAEPGTWQVSVADASISGAGVVGVMRSNNTILSEWRYCGVGTNGDAAPTSAVSGTTPVDRDADLRWAALAATQRDAEIRWGLLATAYQDADARWALLSAAQADLDARWAALASAQVDLDTRWELLSALAQVSNDLTAQWMALAVLHRDADVRWAALSAAQVDLDTRWANLVATLHDVDLRWDLLSSVLTAMRDLELRWSTLAAVARSLDTQWASLTPVLADHDLRWRLAIAVAADLDTRWDLLAGVLSAQSDLDLRWALVATTDQDLTVTWRVGDGDPHPVTIHRIRPDRRIHAVPRLRQAAIH